MIFPGLVSVTFRQLSPEQIVALAIRAQLRGIEWGGDIHVPSGDRDRAQAVRALCRNARLSVVSYGSYYRAGADPRGNFAPVLETAMELGAPNIRVWAGTLGSALAHDDDRQRVCDDLRRIAELSSAAQITVSLEFHDDTLADNPDATLALLDRVDHTALRTYWQPPHGQSADDATAGLVRLLPHLSHLHVFHWWPPPQTRLPLAQGAERWSRFLETASRAPGDRFALLEFVPDNSPDAFLRDAAELRTWLARSTSPHA